MYVSGYGQSLETLFWARAIDKVLAHADCQSAIQPIDNRRYSVAQTGSLLYRRLLTGYGCATICANFVNGPVRQIAANLRYRYEVSGLRTAPQRRLVSIRENSCNSCL